MTDVARDPATATGLLRVCVISSAPSRAVYPRLAECTELEVVGQVPWLDPQLFATNLLDGADVVLVGVDGEEMSRAAVQGALLWLTRRSDVVAIVAGRCDVEVAAQLGVRGLVGSDVEPAAIVRVTRAVANGEVAFPRGALATLLRLVGRHTGPPGATDTLLTDRQREVVALIAAGATDREVARRLRISESTAHKHVQNALQRSHARTRSQLVALVENEPIRSS